MANKEISELKQILGLQQNKDYSDPNSIKTLRYGHLMLMTDQVTITSQSCIPGDHRSMTSMSEVDINVKPLMSLWYRRITMAHTSKGL